MHPAPAPHPLPPAASASDDEVRTSAAAFKRLHPRTYLERFLGSGLREDGRAFPTWRRLAIVPGVISSSHGSCLVRCGATTVIAAVKAEWGGPAGLHPAGGKTAGWLVPNIEIAPLSSSRSRPGAPSDEAQVLADRLAEMLCHPSRPVLDPRALAIQQDVAAWCLYLDISVVSHDGNIGDVAVLAALGALRNTRLPKSLYDDRSGQVVCSPHAQDASPLPLLCFPLSFTFGVYEGTHLLTDPTAFEENFTSTSSVTVGLAVDTKLGSRWAQSTATSSASGAHAGAADAGGDDDDDDDGMDLDLGRTSSPTAAEKGVNNAPVRLLRQTGYCRAARPGSEKKENENQNQNQNQNQNERKGNVPRPGSDFAPPRLMATHEVVAYCLAQAQTRYAEVLELLQAAAA